MIGPDGIMRPRCLNLNCAQRSPLVTSRKRRQFIMGLGGAAMWPRAARAQHPDGVRCIGVLAGLAEDDPEIQSRLASSRRGNEATFWQP
jgi:hypothetical protein